MNVRFGLTQESALHVAAASGAEKLSTALILAGADPSMLDREERSPLHLAAEGGNDGVVDILLEHEADPNGGAVDEYSTFSERTPLHLAADLGHELIVSKLLGGGADKGPARP